MAPWQFWKSRETKSSKSISIRQPRPTLEQLEVRTVLSGPSVAPGYTLRIFATNPSGSSQPDSIAVDGANVYVGFGDGVAKDGSDGKSSTVVQFNLAGAVLQTFSVPGHNDGLKVDPATHLLWALQNEDGNPNLVVINPATGTGTMYMFGPVANGGGFDDITFLHGNVYLSESNPADNPNTAPAVVQASLSGTMVNVSPVLFGNAAAVNVVTKQPVTLNLQDPDSMTASPSGQLVMTSQADDEIVTIKHPGESNQSVGLLPLTDSANNPVSVDDTLFRRGAAGEVLLTDLSTGVIYAITGPPLREGLALSAAQDIGQLGTLDFDTGIFTPIITGLGSPRGLATLTGHEEAAPVVLSAQGNYAVANQELLPVTGTVATFTSFAGASAGDFTATIDWGDGTTSIGAISGSKSSFSVMGTHTYAEDGDNETGVADIFPISVTISSGNGPSVTVTSRAYVSEEALVILTAQGGLTINTQELQFFTAPVATFTSTSGAVAGEFTAAINWGDGTTSAGTISGPDSNGIFTVSGSHTYPEDGKNEMDLVDTYPIEVTINGGSGNTATATSTALVSEAHSGGRASLPSQGQVPIQGLQASAVQQVTAVPLTKTQAPDSKNPGATSNELYQRLYSSHGDQFTDLNALATDGLALALQGSAP
jgi:hypothetical protein